MTDTNKFISAVSVLLSYCFSKVQFSHSYRSMRSKIILYNFNIVSLLLVVNVRESFKSSIQYAGRMPCFSALKLLVYSHKCTSKYFFFIHGSVHHESNLIIVQQDVTYSVYYISVGSSTCFRC